jgi:Glycosyl hydrolase family 26
MLRSSVEQNRPKRAFVQDADFRPWARGARELGTPFFVEFGTEVNGQRFPWNGWWNGKGQRRACGDPSSADGSKRFRNGYRRIIQTMHKEGAGSVLWVFHANCGDYPRADWNRLENYYPGGDYIDCLGVSVYDAQTPMEKECPEFRRRSGRVGRAVPC